MIDRISTCKDAINHVREQMILMMNEGNSVDFLIIENLLHKTMDLKRDIDRFLCAKEIDNEGTL